MVNNKDPPLLSRPAGECFGFWAFSLYFRSPMVQSHPGYRGACSLPAIDHDSRARYTIFTWTGGRWEFSRSWVPYEVDPERPRLERAACPTGKGSRIHFDRNIFAGGLKSPAQGSKTHSNGLNLALSRL